MVRNFHRNLVEGEEQAVYAVGEGLVFSRFLNQRIFFLFNASIASVSIVIELEKE